LRQVQSPLAAASSCSGRRRGGWGFEATGWLLPPLAADFDAAKSLSSHWTSFEMHNWFMLVHFSCAST
jgi:hypothetical protein